MYAAKEICRNMIETFFICVYQIAAGSLEENLGWLLTESYDFYQPRRKCMQGRTYTEPCSGMFFISACINFRHFWEFGMVADSVIFAAAQRRNMY